MPELPDLMRLAGILLIVFFLFRMQMRRSQSRRRAERQVQQPAVRHHAADVRRQDADQWELDLHEAARDVMAEVQTKTAILQQLIHDATVAAERLELAVRAGRQQQHEAHFE